MRERTWKARLDKLLTEESKQPESWWWLSFCDEDGFLGAILTKARGFASAIHKTHELGINPGGEAACAQLPEEAIARAPVDFFQYADRLLSRKEIEDKLGGAAKMP